MAVGRGLQAMGRDESVLAPYKSSLAAGARGVEAARESSNRTSEAHNLPHEAPTCAREAFPSAHVGIAEAHEAPVGLWTELVFRVVHSTRALGLVEALELQQDAGLLGHCQRMAADLSRGTVEAQRLVQHPQPARFPGGFQTNKCCFVGCGRVRYIMPRLSIDISPEQHQKLKAIAALKGQSIKEYVLDRALGDAPSLEGLNEDEAFRVLADFLRHRIAQARRGQLSTKSVDVIRQEERKRAGL